jgi:hypothetical protein
MNNAPDWLDNFVGTVRKRSTGLRVRGHDLKDTKSKFNLPRGPAHADHHQPKFVATVTDGINAAVTPLCPLWHPPHSPPPDIGRRSIWQYWKANAKRILTIPMLTLAAAQADATGYVDRMFW